MANFLDRQNSIFRTSPSLETISIPELRLPRRRVRETDGLMYRNQFYNRKKRNSSQARGVSGYRKNAEILRWRRNSSSVTVELMNEQLVSLRVLRTCTEAIYFHANRHRTRTRARSLCFSRVSANAYSHRQVFILITDIYLTSFVHRYIRVTFVKYGAWIKVESTLLCSYRFNLLISPIRPAKVFQLSPQRQNVLL